jgi:3D (Asp-Asp-Asp) domain-containing protein
MKWFKLLLVGVILFLVCSSYLDIFRDRAVVYYSLSSIPHTYDDDITNVLDASRLSNIFSVSPPSSVFRGIVYNIKIVRELEAVTAETEVDDTDVNIVRNLGTFKSTAYDLSVESCGKLPSHPAYGITASGYPLAGKSREDAKAVAVDPNVISLGTKLFITFPNPYSHFTGVYTAVDTGSAIKGRKIDLYMGESAEEESRNYGIREVEISVVG